MDTPANPNIPPVSASPPVPSVPPVNPTVNPAPPNPAYVQPLQPPIQPPVLPVFATFWQRFWAVILDGVIMSLMGLIVGFIFGFVIGFSGAALGIPNSSTAFPKLLSSIVSYILGITYYIYFIGSKGQTLGKMALKIKVVKQGTNLPPGYLSAFLREVVGKLVSTVIVFLGYFWILWDPQKQTWHDKIAGTIVIHA